MSDAGPRDHLYERLFTPWVLPQEEWPLCKEDWKRVDAVCGLPWQGHILDVGSGDGTLAAMVCSRNPLVRGVMCVEPDDRQRDKMRQLWMDTAWPISTRPVIPSLDDERVDQPYDGALVCEVLEHLTPEDGLALLKQVKAACKPGAMVCVTVPYRSGTRAVHPGHRLVDRHELKSMVEAAGFGFEYGTLLPDYAHAIWEMTIVHA